MRHAGLAALALVLTACTSSSPDEGAGQVQVHHPPDPCPPLYAYRDGECVVREVYVPGGTFVMGRGWCEDPQPQSEPLGECVLRDQPQTVTVPSFWVDIAPIFPRSFPCQGEGCVPDSVAWSEWRGGVFSAFSSSESYTSPEVEDPTQIWWCEQEGKRLIREDEWEFLVTGGGTRLYPWGDAPPSCDLARWDPSCPLPPDTPPQGWPRVTPWIAVDAYPPSPEGVYGLIDLYPHLVAASPHVVYGDSYSPFPFTRVYPSAKKCYYDNQPDPAYCAVAPARCSSHPGEPCEELAWAVRGGRVAGENGQLLLSAQSLRGPARSLSVRTSAVYIRCARDAK